MTAVSQAPEPPPQGEASQLVARPGHERRP
jgi:hypothetical protein